ncbi:MAG: hypothetical protein GY838_18880 [bacterium]|nr:hypothetical protein [bacterium]
MSQGIRPMVRCAVLATCLLAVILVPATAAAVGPAGTWQGKMLTPDGGEFDITLVLDGSGSRWSGNLTEPDSGAMPLQNLRVTATRVTFTFRPASGGVPAHFTGGYIAGDDRITGTFSVRGGSRFVKFDRVADGEGEAMSLAQPLPTRVRHPYKFALTGRAAFWPAVHTVKDEAYKINDHTKSAWNFDAALRYFVLDGFCVLVRGYRGGLGFDEDVVKDHTLTGLSGDSYFRLDGWEFGLTGYLGNIMMSESKFNPYVSGGGGQVDWALTESGRGSESVVLERTALEGTDWAAYFAIGTEYEISSSLALEFEWAWRTFMTSDEMAWPDTDTTFSDTSAWSLGMGLTWGFY